MIGSKNGGNIVTDSSQLKLFATHPHPCSYLDNKEATTTFIDPEATVDKPLYSQLADMGFRRSGSHIYRPSCADCNACIPARVRVEDFNRQRKHRRIWSKNQDLSVEKVTDIRGDEYFSLYQRYINTRHTDGDMFPADRDEYHAFLCSNFEMSESYRFSLAGKLICLAVTDKMEQGISAIYTFFDPDQHARSLGVYAVLWQIEEVKRLGLTSLYLGYWIKDCQKMNYKINYRPLELLINGRWLALT